MVLPFDDAYFMKKALQEAEEAFDKDTNHVWIIDSFGRFEEVSTTYKSRVARKIFDYVAKKI